MSSQKKKNPTGLRKLRKNLIRYGSFLPIQTVKILVYLQVKSTPQ